MSEAIYEIRGATTVEFDSVAGIDEAVKELFTEILTDYLKQVDYIESLVKATSRGTTEERLAAIDSLYTVTPTGGKFILSDFAHKAVKLDPENKSGLVGKYYFIIVNCSTGLF